MPAKAIPRTARLRVLVPLFTLVRLLTSTAFRMVYPFLPAFRDGLGVSVASLTTAIGARSLVAGLLGPFTATWGDTRGRKTGMLLGMALFVGGAAIVAFWPTFAGFTLAMMLTILGKVTFDPSIQAYLGDRVPYARRSQVLTLTELSWSGAYILGIPAVGFVIARAGWIAPFPLLGLLVLLCAALIWIWVPKDPPVDGRDATRLLHKFGEILATPTAVTALFFTGLICVANEIINLTFGVWMEASFGLQLAALGASAAVLGAAELSGEGLVALVTDRLGKRRSILLGTAVNCVAVALLPFVGGSLVLALAALFLFYISFEFTIVSAIPLMTEVMPQARATMMAAFFTSASFGRALASGLTSWLYGIGFGASVLAVLVANLLAIIVLRRLHLGQDG
jgi:predicted MFS family arabinose efflux permease